MSTMLRPTRNPKGRSAMPADTQTLTMPTSLTLDDDSGGLAGSSTHAGADTVVATTARGDTRS